MTAGSSVSRGANLAQRPGHRGPRADQRGQPPGRGHASHHHQVVADPASGPWISAAQVHVGREVAAELDLADACRRAGLRGAEVEEAEIDRPFSACRPSRRRGTPRPRGSQPPEPTIRPAASRHRPFRLGHLVSLLGSSFRTAAGSENRVPGSGRPGPLSLANTRCVARPGMDFRLKSMLLLVLPWSAPSTGSSTLRASSRTPLTASSCPMPRTRPITELHHGPSSSVRCPCVTGLKVTSPAANGPLSGQAISSGCRSSQSPSG